MSLLNCIPWFNKPVQHKPPKDNWAGCDGGFYVHDYRSGLENVAQELWNDSGPKVYTRFDPVSKAAEILTDRYGVLAVVNVHGSEGAPYEAVIGLNPLLKSEVTAQIKEKIRHMFGRLSLEFRVMELS